MKKLLLVSLFVGSISVGSVSLFGQSAFDGTWRLNTQTAQFKGNDTFSLQNGMWRCDTCVPKIAVKADGNDQKVSGSPYFDTLSVRQVDDHTVEITGKKAGKVTGTQKLTGSDDGKTLTTEWSFVAQNGQQGNGKFNSDRVGDAPAGSNKVSGTWHANKVEGASDNVSLFTYKVTADGLSMSDPTGDSYTAKFDGKDYPYKGDPGTTSVSLKKIDDNTIEESDKRNGKVITVFHMTVDPDGKTMKITVEDKLRDTSSNWTADKQ
jgi:hypothetical protein